MSLQNPPLSFQGEIVADGLNGFLRLAEEVVEAGVAHTHKCLGRLVLAVAGVGAVVVHLPD